VFSQAHCANVSLKRQISLINWLLSLIVPGLSKLCKGQEKRRSAHSLSVQAVRRAFMQQSHDEWETF
jgi:hypothetical protein